MTQIAQHAQIGLGNNYRFVIAKEQDIAEAVLRQDDRKLWTPKEAIESLRAGGEAALIWLQILRERGLPSFAQAQEYKNLVPSVLRNSLATLISGTTITPTLKANYIALGSGSTAPANGDTTLVTETLRGAFVNRFSANNVAYLDHFFPTASVGGNSYNEAGIFVDGSASVNTGYLLSRVLVTLTLGANQTLTINSTITVS